MILLFAIILLIYVSLSFEAIGDAQAFEEGESNHKAKYVRESAKWLIIFINGYMGNNIKQFAIIVLIYVSIRIMYFDTFLNHIRNKPPGYKTTPNYIKWIAGIIWIVLIYVYKLTL